MHSIKKKARRLFLIKFLSSLCPYLQRAIDNMIGDNNMPKRIEMQPNRPSIKEKNTIIMNITSKALSSCTQLSFITSFTCRKGSNMKTNGAYLMAKKFFSVQPIWFKTPPPKNSIVRIAKYNRFLFTYICSLLLFVVIKFLQSFWDARNIVELIPSVCFRYTTVASLDLSSSSVCTHRSFPLQSSPIKMASK